MLQADSPRQAEIRAEARAFLAERVKRWKQRHRLGDQPPFPLQAMREWQRTLADGGWGAPMWPPEYGGRGFGPVEGAVWSQERARAGAAIPFNIVGFGMAGPTIIVHGTPEQKQRYISPLLRGDEIWCQLFSEPGAGSDLSAVQTRAERDGEHWVVNGQKVWSSDADLADFGILLARHDPSLPQRKGLSFFIVDMHAPGVEVRPLRQLNGDAHFSEVFLTDVRIPDTDRVGEPGEGWSVARTTLLYERMSLGDVTAGITFPFAKLVRIAKERGHTDEVTRHDLVSIYTQERLLSSLNNRIMSKLGKGEIPTAEGSILKLMLSSLGTDAATLGVRLLGGDGALMSPGGPQEAFLWERAMHIGGGTDEVQRNQIAERVLGLPRDPLP
jgi:alkylation response protein AidB-like acyl-CoA dehydrogenase